MTLYEVSQVSIQFSTCKFMPFHCSLDWEELNHTLIQQSKFYNQICVFSTVLNYWVLKDTKAINWEVNLLRLFDWWSETIRDLFLMPHCSGTLTVCTCDVAIFFLGIGHHSDRTLQYFSSSIFRKNSCLCIFCPGRFQVCLGLDLDL